MSSSKDFRIVKHHKDFFYIEENVKIIEITRVYYKYKPIRIFLFWKRKFKTHDKALEYLIFLKNKRKPRIISEWNVSEIPKTQ